MQRSKLQYQSLGDPIFKKEGGLKLSVFVLLLRKLLLSLLTEESFLTG